MKDLTNLWMQTYTGKRFYPLAPDPEMIDPVDIAHALGAICRYGGHTLTHYSVAEHCVILSDWVPGEHALWALLHDATEAYVGDMIRPLKHSAGMSAYVEAEDRVMAAVAERFGLESSTMPDAVKEGDNRIILDERAAVLRPTGEAWEAEKAGGPLGVRIRAWQPRIAELEWLWRLGQLGGLS